MYELAPYAACDANSRGRVHPESTPRYRSAFQRDRDRIVHSAAFRRLEYKTQVFVNHEGDMYRTRLTHSIEVAQIARTIARVLCVNEDLTEAIALAHDLGHTPFGHAGQDALDACMREHGGFEHNLQSLRVVDELEERYAHCNGLNLTFEAREGILKHCTPAKARELGALGERFLEGGHPSLEAQITNVADEIAYVNHDVDDGVRAGLIGIDELREVALFHRHYAEVVQAWRDLPERRLVHEVVRRMINELVVDLVETTRAAVRELAPRHIDEVRGAPDRLVRFSAETGAQQRALKRFLYERMYQHYRVRRMARKAERILGALYEAFMADPALLPAEAGEKARVVEERQGSDGRARAVADYIAGMTDRYAIAEHERIFDPRAHT
jgi:dGTPase